MKKVLSLILCALIIASCFALCAYAEEETTAEETTFDPLHIVFNASLTGKKNIVDSMNGMGKGGISKTNEWTGFKIEITNSDDPHLAVNYSNYIKKTNNQPHNIEDTPFIVLRLLVDEILFDDFEIYYCAGEVISFTEDCRASSDYAHDAGDGSVYFVYDLTDDAQGEMRSFRIDINAAEIGALMYLTDMVFFATEEEALEWCGYYKEEPEPEPTQSETNQPEQTEAKTEAPTTQQTTEAQTETEAKTEAAADNGCGSVIGTGLAAFALIALGALCIKKKD